MLTVAGFQLPVIPLVEVVGNVGGVAPLQIEFTIVNVGKVFEFTLTVTVVVVAHCPAVGVKVYVAVAVLLTVAGFQVPLIPFVEVVGSMGAVPPLHTDVAKLNVGVMFGLTVTVNVVVVAHCPAVGVNVYVAVAVLLTVAGFHVPVIPLLEIVGNIGAVAPSQMAATAVNVGVTFGLTVTVTVSLTAQTPAVGVKI